MTQIRLRNRIEPKSPTSRCIQPSTRRVVELIGGFDLLILLSDSKETNAGVIYRNGKARGGSGAGTMTEK